MNAADTGAGVDHAAGAGPAPDPPRRPTRLRDLADEQAALRPVATQVACGARPVDVFSAVADELAHLIGAEATFVSSIDFPGADPAATSQDPQRYTTVRS